MTGLLWALVRKYLPWCVKSRGSWPLPSSDSMSSAYTAHTTTATVSGGASNQPGIGGTLDGSCKPGDRIAIGSPRGAGPSLTCAVA